jgi:hypothetical protein
MIVARRRRAVVGIAAIGLSVRSHREAECARGEREHYESGFHLQFLVRVLPTRRHRRRYRFERRVIRNRKLRKAFRRSEAVKR